MKYKNVVAKKYGGPEVLQVVENELNEPSTGQVRIKVLAVSVCRPDITLRRGESLFSSTPLRIKAPFVPGYAIIGEIDALGAGVTNWAVGDRVGALLGTGGYSEEVYRRSDRLIPVSTTVDPGEAVTLILNYIVAYQVLHRSAKVNAGDKILIIGASGGIGTALLQLGQLAGLKMYGTASKNKHHFLAQYGAIPIDYHTQDFVDVIRQAEPDGLDAVFDGMSGDCIQRGLSVLKRGGVQVSFGEPANMAVLAHSLGMLVKVNLVPDGKRYKLYGTSFYNYHQKPFLEDWAELFRLLETGQIDPIIDRKFSILEAAKANELLESGEVIGNVILLAPDNI